MIAADLFCGAAPSRLARALALAVISQNNDISKVVDRKVGYVEN